MKKLLYLFLLLSIYSTSYGQKRSSLSIQQIEKQIEVYTQKNFNSFQLSPEEVLNIKSGMIDEVANDGATFDEKMFESAINRFKSYKLRIDFFSKFPEKKLVYEAPLLNSNLRQSCTDGGFENDDSINVYTFRQAINPTTGVSTNIVTTDTTFVPITVVATINSFDSFATLVSNVADPNIPTLPAILNGSRAIKLNRSGNNSLMDVTTMSRIFTINENTFNYNYSLVMENPTNRHYINTQPFFVVRLYDSLGNIIRQSAPSVANINDCMFLDSALPIQPESPLLYSGWICDQINTSDLIGQQVRVEFIIADCAQTGHFATVYIDDICDTNCANPLSGSINLNPIQTINCPVVNQTICGTFTLPRQSTLNTITLNILQDSNVISTITTPTTLIGNTFCFNVPLSTFGLNPNGNFEFRAIGNFTRICTAQGNFPLDPISDNSANDSGPDVAFSNCINAVNDSFTTSTCAMGSFSILNNDTVFSSPATISNTIITQTSPVIPQLTLNASTGQVTVNSVTMPGTYTISYQICNANNPSHCDTASIVVLVNPPLVEAIQDDFSSQVINACVGGTTSSVLNNDLFCGVPITSSMVNVVLQNNGGIVGANISSNGNISIPANTPIGLYTLTYKICLISNSIVCDTATVNISIVSGALPTFDFVTAICEGAVPPILPSVSNNGIVGTWSPSVINNLIPGNYIFTPSGNCALPATISITFRQDCGIFFEWGSDVSCQVADGENPHIKIDANIEDGPCIRVCENSNIEYQFTGNVNSIAYTDWQITGGTYTSTNTSCTIQWNSNVSSSAIQATIHLVNGTVLILNRCIEKLMAPNALFGIMPNNTLNEVEVCVNNEVAFDNLTTANNGHDDIYYNWDFGDGTTSNAFEPTHVYTQTGSFAVTLKAFNGCSCIGEYKITVIVEKGITPIECPSVVCENDRTTYTVPQEFGNNCEINWEVVGGEIVEPNGNNTEISVIWNHIDENGFGYLMVGSQQCYKCTTTVKVPVVMNHGTIKGTQILCEKAQGLYVLPQWPTTDFIWTLNDVGTGATLIQTNQRNEIIIQAGSAGVIQLSCNYFNTLLGCGGTAIYEINVTPSLTVVGNNIVCSNSTHSYNFTYQGNDVTPVQWQITGPGGSSQNGTNSPFSYTFPSIGIYSVSVNDPNYCMREVFQIQVIDRPQSPTSISGPLTICPGIPVSYSCSIPNGATANWVVTNGTIIGNNTGSQVMVNFDPLATTQYEIKLSFLVDNCYSDVLTTVVNATIPIIDFNPIDQVVCGSSIATYAINAIDVDNYVWSISPASAGTIQSGQNTNQIYILWNQTPQTGVGLTVTVRKCGKAYSGIVFIDVINSPAISISGPTQACTRNPISFGFALSSGTGFSSVLWDFGDGTTATSTSSSTISHIYNEPISTSTTYTVTATVTGANGCLMPSIATHSIAVAPSPVVTLSPTVDINLCNAGNTIADYTYSVNMQGGFSATDTIQWYNGLGAIPNQTYPTINIATLGAGTYYAVVKNVFLCTDTTSSFTVTNDCFSGGGCDFSNIINGTATNTGCNDITVDITSFSGTPTEVFISYPPSLSANVTNISPNHLVLNGLNPGQYSVTLTAEHSNGCPAIKHVSFIVPYKAGIKYNITCGTNGGYNVQLLNYSVYFPDTPPTSFEFTTDNGLTWHTEVPVGASIPQFNTILPPGNYTIGIKIKRASYPSCTYFETLVLPNFPIATFTNDEFACQNNAMHFYADDRTPGLQYIWDFISDGSSNLQRDPVKSFSSSDLQYVTLTVKNKFGCSTSHTEAVNVVPNNMDGYLSLVPINACIGSSMEITYTRYPSTDPVQTLNWYHNILTPVPFAVTHASSNLNLTVTQSGQYFVYAQNYDGCMEYGNIKPISVAFVPTPEPPLVKGATPVCINNSINLSVPVNSNMHYEWTLNGNPMPAWHNLTTINHVPTAIGDYVFTVASQVVTSGGSVCSSPATTFVVTVLDRPNRPKIAITHVQCNPYTVAVSVTNPQVGVSYYWSNGSTGTTATITHDGPLQVRAEANGCSITSQLDLPTDLEALAWIFPNGCFTVCNKNETNGYIIGPLGEFEAWKWFASQNGTIGGSGNINPLAPITAPNDYQLFLSNGYCNTVFENAAFNLKNCDECNISTELKQMKCIKINGEYVYEVDLTMINNTGVPVTITITAPNNEGYFTSSTVTLFNVVNLNTFYFYPMNGFSGGNVFFAIEGVSDNGDCFNRLDIDFPNCSGTPRMSNNNTIFIAPNPTKDFTTLLYELQNKGAVAIEISDPTGRIIWTKNLDNNSGKVIIDCSQYASSIYAVTIKQNGVVVAHTKLIVQ